MNRSRIVATFVLALVIAGAASFFVLKKLRQTAARASTTYSVVLAKRNLDIGTKLTEADLRLADWGAGAPPQGHFAKVPDAVGRAVLYPVFQDEMILESKLAPVGSGAGLPAVIPEGMRAVSIRVDEVVAVAGFVGPGTRVDVLVTGNPGAGRGGSEPLTKTILENVQVLAAGQKIQPDAQGKAEKVNVVTLLCTPEDAARVTMAANDGRIQLVLRNPTDSQQAAKKPAVFRHALYGEGGPPAEPKQKPVVAKKPSRPAPPPVAVVAPPPPLPPQPTTTVIEIVRGEKVTKVELEIRPEGGANR